MLNMSYICPNEPKYILFSRKSHNSYFVVNDEMAGIELVRGRGGQLC